MLISRTKRVCPSQVETPNNSQRAAPTSGGSRKLLPGKLSGLLARQKGPGPESMAPRSATSLPKSDCHSTPQKASGISGSSWMTKATKGVSKVMNRGLHKAGKAFSGLGNILHEPQHEPIYSPYSKAEQEEAAYYGHEVSRETPASTTPYRQSFVKTNSHSHVPTVAREMTWEERRDEDARAEYFHERPDYMVQEPDLAALERTRSASRIRAPQGLDTSPQKMIWRSMSAAEIELERARADHYSEQPNISEVVDHESMSGQFFIEGLTRQLSKPSPAKAMTDNMSDFLYVNDMTHINKFTPQEFLVMMVKLTRGTKYADATKDLIRKSDIGAKLKDRWKKLRDLQIAARAENSDAQTLTWLMENHTEAFIEYLGSGSKRTKNILLELINS
jgi:hypothetical protein